MKERSIYSFDELQDRVPAHALVADVDLVVIRYDDNVSVLYGRCAHRGALMADGHIDGDNIIEDAEGRPFKFSLTYPGGNATYEQMVLFLKDAFGQAGVVMYRMGRWMSVSSRFDS